MPAPPPPHPGFGHEVTFVARWCSTAPLGVPHHVCRGTDPSLRSVGPREGVVNCGGRVLSAGEGCSVYLVSLTGNPRRGPPRVSVVAVCLAFVCHACTVQETNCGIFSAISGAQYSPSAPFSTDCRLPNPKHFIRLKIETPPKPFWELDNTSAQHFALIFQSPLGHGHGVWWAPREWGGAGARSVRLISPRGRVF